MKICQQINGRKVYVAVDMDEALSNFQAVRIANQHFKESASKLKCEIGRVIGDSLYLDDSPGEYPKGKQTDVWVVTRK